MNLKTLFTDFLKTEDTNAGPSNGALDLRGLAIFRMGLGLMLLTDLIIRGQSISAFYTESGMFPTRFLHKSAYLYKSTFHDLFTTYDQVLWIFILHGLLALLFAIGFKVSNHIIEFGGLRCWYRYIVGNPGTPKAFFPTG